MSEKLLLRTNKCSEHKKNTTDDPRFYCCQTCKMKELKLFLQRFRQTFCFGDVCGDGVEDVDQHEEDGDKEGHPPGDHVRGDQE